MRRTIIFATVLLIILSFIPTLAEGLIVQSEEYLELSAKAQDIAMNRPVEAVGMISLLERLEYYKVAIVPPTFSEESSEFLMDAQELTRRERDLLIMTLSGTAYTVLSGNGQPFDIESVDVPTGAPAPPTPIPEMQGPMPAPTPTPKPTPTPWPTYTPFPTPTNENMMSMKRNGTYRVLDYVEIQADTIHTATEVTVKNASDIDSIGFTGFMNNPGEDMVVCTLKMRNLSKSPIAIYNIIQSVTYTNADGYTFSGGLYAEDLHRRSLQTNMMHIDPNTDYYIHLYCNIMPENTQLRKGAYMTIQIRDQDDMMKSTYLNIEY